jgi:hypothetical protein
MAEKMSPKEQANSVERVTAALAEFRSLHPDLFARYEPEEQEGGVVLIGTNIKIPALTSPDEGGFYYGKSNVMDKDQLFEHLRTEMEKG